jgi:hypothetical protein
MHIGALTAGMLGERVTIRDPNERAWLITGRLVEVTHSIRAPFGANLPETVTDVTLEIGPAISEDQPQFVKLSLTNDYDVDGGPESSEVPGTDRVADSGDKHDRNGTDEGDD